MNPGFGLRTMSAANCGYSPLSYHCGSVWSHDTAIAILGLARSGHLASAAALTDGLLEAASAFDWRLPSWNRARVARPCAHADIPGSASHSRPRRRARGIQRRHRR
jgi:hypothetical protein